jgi:ABC-type sugar transport system substrate-binding protein
MILRHLRHLLSVLLLALCVSCLLIGCRTRGTAARTPKIGFSIYSLERPWHSAYLQAFKVEAKKHPHLQIDWFVGNSDLAAINAAIEEWIARKVDCIVSSSPDHMGLRLTYQKALAAGIPVVLTGDVPDYRIYEYMTAFSGFSSWDASRIAALLLDQALGGKGKIAHITGPRGSAPEQQSTEGFRTTLQQLSSRIQVVAVEDGKWDATVAYQKALDILTRYPRIDAFYTASDIMGSAVIRALKQKGYSPGQVKVVAQGGSRGSIVDLKEGWYLGIVNQDPIFCARQDIWMMKALLEDHQLLPSIAQVRQIIIMKANVDQFQGW